MGINGSGEWFLRYTPDGAGSLWAVRSKGGGRPFLEHRVRCEQCDGEGNTLYSAGHQYDPRSRTYRDTCQECDGRGTVDVEDCECADCLSVHRAVDLYCAGPCCETTGLEARQARAA